MRLLCIGFGLANFSAGAMLFVIEALHPVPSPWGFWIHLAAWINILATVVMSYGAITGKTGG